MSDRTRPYAPAIRAMQDPGKPGDETPPGSPQSAGNTCRHCAGTGEVKGKPCPDCEGTGIVTTIVGDA